MLYNNKLMILMQPVLVTVGMYKQTGMNQHTKITKKNLKTSIYYFVRA